MHWKTTYKFDETTGQAKRDNGPNVIVVHVQVSSICGHYKDFAVMDLRMDSLQCHFQAIIVHRLQPFINYLYCSYILFIDDVNSVFVIKVAIFEMFLF